MTLSCETSEDVATVDWLKNDEHLSRDDGCHGYEMSDSGRVHSLTILAAALSDEAKYTCSCRDDVTSGLVLVEGTSGTTSYLRSSYTYKTEKCLVCVCVCVCLSSVCSSFLLHDHSFKRICTKFGAWHPYSLQMVMGVSERRSRTRARARRAIYTPMQMTGELRREIRN